MCMRVVGLGEGGGGGWFSKEWTMDLIKFGRFNFLIFLLGLNIIERCMNLSTKLVL